ncbi:MAG: hypothetical protein AB1896_19265, partial [Thermodesulfobacteriota bacterium]
MNRQGYYTQQVVTKTHLSTLQNNIEGADWNHQKDLHGAGILTGLSITQNDPADLTVLVAIG